MNVGAPLVTYPQAAKLAEPGKCPLHHPAQASKTLIPLSTTGNEHSYTTSLKPATYALSVIRFVRHHHRRPLPRPPSPLPYRRYRIHKRKRSPGVVLIGPTLSYRQRYPAAAGFNVTLAARLRSIRGIRTRLRPPETFRTLLVSITARDQSIAPASPRWSKSTRWIFSHTPAFCQSLNLRQHVMPLPQPISCGRYSHGIPVRNTNSIPVRHARSGTRGRPPLGLGGSGGKSGLTSSRNPSGSTLWPSARPPLLSARPHLSFRVLLGGSNCKMRQLDEVQ